VHAAGSGHREQLAVEIFARERRTASGFYRERLLSNQFLEQARNCLPLCIEVKDKFKVAVVINVFQLALKCQGCGNHDGTCIPALMTQGMVGSKSRL
jgi:hypothetical protein